MDHVAIMKRLAVCTRTFLVLAVMQDAAILAASLIKGGTCLPLVTHYLLTVACEMELLSGVQDIT